MEEKTTKNQSTTLPPTQIDRVWVYDKYNQWICLEDSESRKQRLEAEKQKQEQEEIEQKQQEFKTRLEEEGANVEEINKEKEEWEKSLEEAKKKKDEEKKGETEKESDEEIVEAWVKIEPNQFAEAEGKGLVFLVEKKDGKWICVDKEEVLEVEEGQLKKGMKVGLVVHGEEGSYEREVAVDGNMTAEKFFGEFLEEKLRECFSFCSFGLFHDDKFVDLNGGEITQLVNKEEKQKEHDEQRAKEKEEYEAQKKETEEKNKEIQKKIDEKAEKEKEEAKKKAEAEEAARKKQAEAKKAAEASGETPTEAPQPTETTAEPAQTNETTEAAETTETPAEEPKPEETENKEENKETMEEKQPKQEEELKLIPIEPYVEKKSYFDKRYSNFMQTFSQTSADGDALQIDPKAKLSQISQLLTNPKIDITITRPNKLQICQLYSSILYMKEEHPQLSFSPSSPILLTGLGLFGPFPNGKGVQAFDFTLIIKNLRSKEKRTLRAKVVDKDERVWKFFLAEELFVDSGDTVHVVMKEGQGAVFCLTSKNMYFYGNEDGDSVRFTVGNHFRNGFASLYYRSVDVNGQE
jgi:hypothetical protein